MGRSLLLPTSTDKTSVNRLTGVTGKSGTLCFPAGRTPEKCRCTGAVSDTYDESPMNGIEKSSMGRGLEKCSKIRAGSGLTLVLPQSENGNVVGEGFGRVDLERGAKAVEVAAAAVNFL